MFTIKPVGNMVEYDIVGPSGKRYCSVAYVPEPGLVQIKHLVGSNNLTITFDAKAIPQMIQALKNIQYIQFGQGIKYD